MHDLTDSCAEPKKHEYRYESTYDTSFRPHVARYIQYRCPDLGNADDIGADIRAEYFEVPPDQRAVRDQRNYPFRSRDSHLKTTCPEKHNNHANTGKQEREIPLTYPCGHFG
jgi:hypothetical protein